MVLPFDGYVEEFLRLIRAFQILILAAETGAGKSTRAPLAMLKAGLGGNRKIGVTQPRRMAATLLAHWVSDSNGTELGGTVGYQIGKEFEMSRDTRLVFMTEGVLLAQLQSDPLLMRYDVIVLDEAHERGVNLDLLLALLKGVLAKRSDLKLVVMSATIDTDKFSAYFDGAPVLNVPGRNFSVEVRYARETPIGIKESITAAIAKVDEILIFGERGDILVFMPDQDSIMQVVKGLAEVMGDRARAIRIHALYGAQAQSDQSDVFERDERRRVIVSTNIAETSVTIDGIRHVVDSGYIKQQVYVDAAMSALIVTDHSQAGCNQRKGRAGRTQDGICHRLFTEEDFSNRPAFTTPEILRMSLDQTLLRLRCYGMSMDSVLALDLLDKPETEQWTDADSHLKLLGAVGAKSEVTADGEKMNKFRMDPMLGRMILEGVERECLDEVLIIAACLSATRQIFVYPKGSEVEANAAKKKFSRADSDELTMLAAWEGWYESNYDLQWARNNFLSSRALLQVDRIRDGLLDLFIRAGIDITRSQSEDQLKKAIASGLIVNLAVKNGSKYGYDWNGRFTDIFPGSSVMGTLPRYLVCTNVVRTTKEVTDRFGHSQTVTRSYMRGVHVVEKDWFSEIVPADACKVDISFEYNYETRQQELMYCRSWNGIEFERKVLDLIPDALIPNVTELFMSQLIEGYGPVNERVPWLARLWKQSQPPDAMYYHGEGRQQIIRPVAELFKTAIAKKIASMPALNLLYIVLGSMTPEDVLTGEALESYLARNAAQVLRDRHEVEYQAAIVESARKGDERAQQEAVQLREQVALLDERVRALGFVLDYSATGTKMDGSDFSRRESARISLLGVREAGLWQAKRAVEEYSVVVERLERVNTPKFETTRLVYASLRAALPVCPLCGGAWNDQFRCTEVHSMDRVIAKPGEEAPSIGEFKTDRGDSIAEVFIHRTRAVRVDVEVRENKPWSGRTFKSITFVPHLIILPETLVEAREMIIDYLEEIEQVQKALKAEMTFVEDLKKRVTSGEVIRLVFKENSRGRMEADYKHEKVEAPYADDLDRYPSDGEAWWCHVIPGGSAAKITLYRKVSSVTKADVDSAIAGYQDLFPGLPSQLLH